MSSIRKCSIDKAIYSKFKKPKICILKEKNKLNQLYLATCVNKSLGYKYSWGDSISKTKIRTDKVSLPIKGNQPNYEVMETFISAIQKLVIKDLVLYVERKLKN